MNPSSEHSPPAELDVAVLTLLRAHSGAHLSRDFVSRQLNVSGQSVISSIHQLQDQGYEIEAHPHLGYRLVGVPDLLLPGEIHQALRTTLMGQRIYAYRRVQSTNEVAVQMAQSGAEEGTLVLAEEQLAGRGRLGRVWHSAPGVGLWFSLILRPHGPPDRVFQLTISSALAVAETILASTRLPVRVKWPNDVLIRNRKVAGVLTTTQLEGHSHSYVVLGIGVNVNHSVEDFPQHLQHQATSLKREWGRTVPRLEFLSDLLDHLERCYFLFQVSGLKPFLHRWRQLSGILGQRISVRSGERVFSGLAVDIDDIGALLLREDDGNIRHLLAGDVSLAEEETCG